MERLPLTTRRLLSGRAGRIGIVVVLALGAAHEASAAIVLNVLAVVPLIISRRWPFFAAVAADLITVALLSYATSR